MVASALTQSMDRWEEVLSLDSCRAISPARALSTGFLVPGLLALLDASPAGSLGLLVYIEDFREWPFSALVLV